MSSLSKGLAGLVEIFWVSACFSTYDVAPFFGTTQCTQGFGSVKNHLPRWRQMSLLGKWVCKASESARHVSLPSKWGCQASESAGQGSLPVVCQEASFKQTARQRAFYVRQDISRRGHQCRKPDTKGLQLSIRTQSSPPGIRTHVSSGSGVMSTKGLARLLRLPVYQQASLQSWQFHCNIKYNYYIMQLKNLYEIYTNLLTCRLLFLKSTQAWDIIFLVFEKF